jgi:hypothetical protein
MVLTQVSEKYENTYIFRGRDRHCQRDNLAALHDVFLRIPSQTIKEAPLSRSLSLAGSVWKS